MFAQSITIPDNPTVVWILAAAVLIGGVLMSISVRSAFKMAKDSANETSILVGKVFVVCDTLSVRHAESLDSLGNKFQTSFDRICDTHERAWANVAKEVKNFRKDSTDKLEAIHQDIRNYNKDKPA